MNIKTKLLVLLGLPFMLSILVSFMFIINVTRGKVESQLSERLVDQEKAITRQISEQVLTSAKSYMNALGVTLHERSIETIENSVNSEEAIKKLTAYTSEKTFFTSGYIYITDDNGVIISHPNSSKIGTDSSLKDWLKSSTTNSFKFYEYQGRDKLAYRVYNSVLNINFMISSYVDDFSQSLDLEQLNRAMNQVKIGKLGYPFLVNEKGIMVSHPSEKLLNTYVMNLTDISGYKIIKKIFREKEGNFEYMWEQPDGSHEQKFIYFNYEPNSKLYVCITGYSSEYLEIIDNILRIIFISGGAILLTLILLLIFIARSVSKPVKLFTSSLKDISKGEGDLTQRIDIKSSGEISVMVNTFNGFLESLHELVSHTKTGVNKTVKIKQEVVSGVEESAASLYQISSNLNEIKKQTKYLDTHVETSANAGDNIKTSATTLDSSIEKQSYMLQTSTAAITEMISSIESVDNITNSKRETAVKLLDSAKAGSDMIEETQNAVMDINSKLDSIQEMAHVITDISDRTNLLAMNAAIEAAHAGDAGKGFAVVADEIRKLAESSNSNSARITDSLQGISQSIFSATDLSQKTMNTFNELNIEITEITNALSEINSSTRELQIGSKDILNSITELESASAIVKDGASHINRLSETVKESMENTKNITLEVVTSIDEINNGVSGINESMVRVTNTTQDLEETGNILKENVDRFKT